MDTALHFTQPDPPELGKTIEVADGIFWARLRLPFQLNHVNVYLLEDGDGWTIVDTGTFDPTTRECWQMLLGTGVSGKRLKRVLVTHFHPDHVGSAGWLCRENGAELLMTQQEHALAERMLGAQEAYIHTRYRNLYRLNGMDAALADEVVANGHDYHGWVSDLPEEVTIIKAGDRLRIGQRHFRILTGGGHSPEHAMLHDAENDILLCADQVLARISPNISILPGEPEGNPLGNYLSSIDALKAEVPDSVLVLPGHDIPFKGLHARIETLRQHHLSRCNAIVAACRTQPMSAKELIPHVFQRDLDHMQVGFALTETLAHVNLLIAERRLAGEIVDEVQRFHSI